MYLFKVLLKSVAFNVISSTNVDGRPKPAAKTSSLQMRREESFAVLLTSAA